MPERTQLLVIGGGDAGTAAALRAREIDPALDVTMLVADTYVSHSVCGLPFLVSVEVADWQSLAHRTEDEIAAGARPVRPAIPGVDLPGVHLLHTMDDGIALRRIVDRMGPAATVVIGAGYIGVEIADALTATARRRLTGAPSLHLAPPPAPRTTPTSTWCFRRGCQRGCQTARRRLRGGLQEPVLSVESW